MIQKHMPIKSKMSVQHSCLLSFNCFGLWRKAVALQFKELTHSFSESSKIEKSKCAKEFTRCFNASFDLQKLRVLARIILRVLFFENEYSVKLCTSTSPPCKWENLAWDFFPMNHLPISTTYTLFLD